MPGGGAALKTLSYREAAYDYPITSHHFEVSEIGLSIGARRRFDFKLRKWIVVALVPGHPTLFDFTSLQEADCPERISGKERP